MTKISRLLRNTVKLSDMREYQIAQAAGLHPSTLSRLLNGIERVKESDPRVIAVGRVVGIPEAACFQEAE